MDAMFTSQLYQCKHHPQHRHGRQSQHDAKQRASFGMVDAQVGQGRRSDVGHFNGLGERPALDHRNVAYHMRRMMGSVALFFSNHIWSALSVLSGIVVIVSSLADRRRNRRHNIENVGFMPWTAITVMSVLATVVTAALAIKGV
jgi:hypothetical protein